MQEESSPKGANQKMEENSLLEWMGVFIGNTLGSRRGAAWLSLGLRCFPNIMRWETWRQGATRQMCPTRDTYPNQHLSCVPHSLDEAIPRNADYSISGSALQGPRFLSQHCPISWNGTIDVRQVSSAHPVECASKQSGECHCLECKLTVIYTLPPIS